MENGTSPPVPTGEEDSPGVMAARMTCDPMMRNALLAHRVGSMAGFNQLASITDSFTALAEMTKRAASGDLGLNTRILVSQAVSLDTLFTELARRAADNITHYPDATERYMRLALKAQAGCRATLDALAKLHQPREQVVKHVHVNDGGQAVVADQFHHHAGDAANGKPAEQCHATGAPGGSASLPSSDPLGEPLPVARREREATMQDARWEQSRRAKG